MCSSDLVPSLGTPTDMQTRIDQLSSLEAQTVTLKGWLYNKRGSKGLWFLVLRDGSGLVQCVVNETDATEATWQAASEATQESALVVEGKVRADERQLGGYEVQATRVELLSTAEEYPITPKDHGIEFLMNHRHL